MAESETMSESLPRDDKHRASGLDPNGGQYPNFRWVRVNNVDELEKFYREIVDPLKRAAQELGYALAVHGSMRRDLDAIAVPWAENHADKDDLARALHNAACGLWQAKYQWEAKPCGRSAASFPVCWVDRAEFPNETNLGHIDLSVMPAFTPSHVARTPLPGPHDPSIPQWVHEELKDGDLICEAAGVQRTEGGRLPVQKIINNLASVPSAIAWSTPAEVSAFIKAGPREGESHQEFASRAIGKMLVRRSDGGNDHG